MNVINDSEYKYTDLWIPVKDLTVDRDVQRAFLNLAKVEQMLLHYNPAAVGMVYASKRNAITTVVLDGMHRHEVEVRRSDGAGQLFTRRYEGLTRAQEARLFLDLNAGTRPTLVDRFRVRIVAEDEVAIAISRIVGVYGWTPSAGNNRGNIQAIGAVEGIYLAGQRAEFEPELLDMTIRLVTKAWGLDAHAVTATVLQGLAAVLLEYGSRLNYDKLQDVLKSYPAGAHGLYLDGKQFALSRKVRVTMGIAERIVDEYLKKARGGERIHTWRHRK